MFLSLFTVKPRRSKAVNTLQLFWRYVRAIGVSDFWNIPCGLWTCSDSRATSTGGNGAAEPNC